MFSAGKWLVAAAGMLVCLHAAADARALKDPTRPLRAPAVTAPAASGRALPTLDSVLVGSDRRLAVIDGMRLGEGDERDGIRVWEIRSDAVVVSVDGSPRMVLTIANGRMRKELR